MGTAGYLPPEQIDARAVEPASDQWALAAIVYEALTGAPPLFDGEHEDGPEMAALQQLADGTPITLPSELNQTVGPELTQVAMRGLALVPAERFPSSMAFVAALSAVETDVALPLQDRR
jgi:serine/threonine-protein kinase